jgi:hypothetical protein
MGTAQIDDTFGLRASRSRDAMTEEFAARSQETPEDPLRIYMNARQRLITAKARMDRLAAKMTLVEIALNGRSQNGNAATPSLWKRLLPAKGSGGREISEANDEGKPGNGLFPGIREHDWPSFESVWETLTDWRKTLEESTEAWSRLSEEDRAAVAGPHSV